ncbi:MAG: YciI family protein [Microbacterium sp.]
MRWMMIMQVTPDAAAAAAAELDMEQIVEMMGIYDQELRQAGVMLSNDGLADPSEGFRVDFSTTPPTVTDGPYAEAREVFTGYWILEVASREEIEFWAKKCPLGPGVALEVRPIPELDEIGVAPDNEWIAKEQEWRAANA